MLSGLNYDEKDPKFILLGNVFKYIENKKSKDIYNGNGIKNRLLFVKCLKIFLCTYIFVIPLWA